MRRCSDETWVVDSARLGVLTADSMTRGSSNNVGANQKSRNATAAGGSATGGGINFQAAVAACIAANIAAGEALGWFPGLVADVPTSVLAETGGAGDDLGITLGDGSHIEAQAKKGLTADRRLFDALLSLARGVHNGSCAYAALIVCPNASATIRTTLRADIVRIGQGRVNRVGPLAKRFGAELAAEGLSLESVARRLRIVTMHCLDGDTASIGTARSLLRHVCARLDQTGAAWTELYADATHQIELRGRRTAASIAALLTSRSISLRTEGNAPVANIARIARWAAEANSTFALRGINRPVALDAAWIQLEARVVEQREDEPGEIAKALDQYHQSGWRRRGSERLIAAQTIGWFVPHCVVIAGPGMGKSTLSAVLARRYAQNNCPVLRVSLKALAARMRQGGVGVAEGLIALGLDGSKTTPADFLTISLEGWTLICDGLDETAEQQGSICQGLLNIVAAHPTCRVVVTTRPFGYQSALLGNWRHYELLPLESSKAATHARTLITAMYAPGSLEVDRTHAFFMAERDANEASRVAARSPLLLSLMVSLAARRVSFGASRVSLYEALFRVYEEGVADRSPAYGVPRATARRFLDVLGWTLQMNPAPTVISALPACAPMLARDLGLNAIRAAELAEQCLEFWESHGMVERLRVGIDETITFVHRTFGEYSAARYLANMPPVERDTRLSEYVRHGGWHEVIEFAAALGIADAVVNAALRSVADVTPSAQCVVQAAEVIAFAQPDISSALRAAMLTSALRVVCSPDHRASVSVGAALVPVVMRYQGESLEAVAGLLNHRYPWARLTGWALAVADGQSRLDPRAVSDALIKLPTWYVRSYFHVSTGKLDIGSDGQHELLQTFIVGAVRIVLAQLPPLEAAEIVRKVAQEKYSSSPAIFGAVAKLASDAGIGDLKPSWDDGRPWLPDSSSWNKAVLAADIELLQSLLLGLGASGAMATAAEGPLLHVSAFRAACGYGDERAADVWNRRSSDHRKAVAEVLRGVVHAAQIPREPLASEAAALLQRLQTEDEKSRASIFDWTLPVDVRLDSELVRTARMSVAALEEALLHPSEFVTRLAAFLLSDSVEADQLAGAIERTLPRAASSGLWVSSALADLIPRSRAIPMLVARLCQPITEGCDYLFRKLAEYAPELSTVLPAVRRGLLCSDADVAESAAKLLNALPNTDSPEILLLVRQAYEHWQREEAPYPKGDGTVPMRIPPMSATDSA